MKYFYLVLIFISLTQTSRCQTISFKNLCDLRKMNLAEVEEFLKEKKWAFDSSIEGNDSVRQKVTYVYIAKSSTEGINERDFLNYIGNDKEEKIIKLLTFKRKLYDLVLLQCKASGFKLLESKLEGSSINKIYFNNSTIVEFYSKHIKAGSKTHEYYTIIVWNKSEYNSINALN